MQNMDLIAYNSKTKKIILLIIWIIVFIASIVFSILIEKMKILVIISFVIINVIFGTITIRLLKDKSKIAFEIKENVLYIYEKQNEIKLKFSDITKIDFYDGNGSFDCDIHSYQGRISLHLLLKNSDSIRKQFIKIMKDNGISIVIHEVSIGD